MWISRTPSPLQPQSLKASITNATLKLTRPGNTAGPEVDRSLRYPSNLYHTDLRLAARHQATRVFLEALLETNHVITGNAGVPIDPPCLFRTLFNYWLE